MTVSASDKSSCCSSTSLFSSIVPNLNTSLSDTDPSKSVKVEDLEDSAEAGGLVVSWFPCWLADESTWSPVGVLMALDGSTMVTFLAAGVDWTDGSVSLSGNEVCDWCESVSVPMEVSTLTEIESSMEGSFWSGLRSGELPDDDASWGDLEPVSVAWFSGSLDGFVVSIDGDLSFWSSSEDLSLTDDLESRLSLR